MPLIKLIKGARYHYKDTVIERGEVVDVPARDRNHLVVKMKFFEDYDPRARPEPELMVDDGDDSPVVGDDVGQPSGHPDVRRVSSEEMHAEPEEFEVEPPESRSDGDRTATGGRSDGDRTTSGGRGSAVVNQKKTQKKTSGKKGVSITHTPKGAAPEAAV